MLAQELLLSDKTQTCSETLNSGMHNGFKSICRITYSLKSYIGATLFYCEY